jgi:hypothetical protein
MSFDVSAVNAARAGGVLPQRPSVPPNAGAAAGGDFAAAVRASSPLRPEVDAIPASPPPEVLQQVRAAQRAVDDMYARGRQLHFEMDGSRVKILLQDLDGNVLREIPPSRALEIATGKAVD